MLYKEEPTFKIHEGVRAVPAIFHSRATTAEAPDITEQTQNFPPCPVRIPDPQDHVSTDQTVGG